MPSQNGQKRKRTRKGSSKANKEASKERITRTLRSNGFENDGTHEITKTCDTQEDFDTIPPDDQAIDQAFHMKSFHPTQLTVGIGETNSGLTTSQTYREVCGTTSSTFPSNLKQQDVCINLIGNTSNSDTTMGQTQITEDVFCITSSNVNVNRSNADSFCNTMKALKENYILVDGREPGNYNNGSEDDFQKQSVNSEQPESHNSVCHIEHFNVETVFNIPDIQNDCHSQECDALSQKYAVNNLTEANEIEDSLLCDGILKVGENWITDGGFNSQNVGMSPNRCGSLSQSHELRMKLDKPSLQIDSTSHNLSDITNTFLDRTKRSESCDFEGISEVDNTLAAVPLISLKRSLHNKISNSKPLIKKLKSSSQINPLDQSCSTRQSEFYGNVDITNYSDCSIEKLYVLDNVMEVDRDDIQEVRTKQKLFYNTEIAESTTCNSYETSHVLQGPVAVENAEKITGDDKCLAAEQICSMLKSPDDTSARLSLLQVKISVGKEPILTKAETFEQEVPHLSYNLSSSFSGHGVRDEGRDIHDDARACAEDCLESSSPSGLQCKSSTSVGSRKGVTPSDTQIIKNVEHDGLEKDRNPSGKHYDSNDLVKSLCSFHTCIVSDMKQGPDFMNMKESQDCLNIKESHDCLNMKQSQDCLNMKESQDCLNLKESQDCLKNHDEQCQCVGLAATIAQECTSKIKYCSTETSERAERENFAKENNEPIRRHGIGLKGKSSNTARSTTAEQNERQELFFIGTQELTINRAETGCFMSKEKIHNSMKTNFVQEEGNFQNEENLNNLGIIKNPTEKFVENGLTMRLALNSGPDNMNEDNCSNTLCPKQRSEDDKIGWRKLTESYNEERVCESKLTNPVDEINTNTEASTAVKSTVQAMCSFHIQNKEVLPSQDFRSGMEDILDIHIDTITPGTIQSKYESSNQHPCPHELDKSPAAFQSDVDTHNNINAEQFESSKHLCSQKLDKPRATFQSEDVDTHNKINAEPFESSKHLCPQELVEPRATFQSDDGYTQTAMTTTPPISLTAPDFLNQSSFRKQTALLTTTSNSAADKTISHNIYGSISSTVPRNVINFPKSENNHSKYHSSSSEPTTTFIITDTISSDILSVNNSCATETSEGTRNILNISMNKTGSYVGISSQNEKRLDITDQNQMESIENSQHTSKEVSLTILNRAMSITKITARKLDACGYEQKPVNFPIAEWTLKDSQKALDNVGDDLLINIPGISSPYSSHLVSDLEERSEPELGHSVSDFEGTSRDPPGYHSGFQAKSRKHASHATDLQGASQTQPIHLVSDLEGNPESELGHSFSALQGTFREHASCASDFEGTSSAQLIHLEPDIGGKGRQNPNHLSDFQGTPKEHASCALDFQGTSNAQLIHLEPDAGGKGRQHPCHPSDFHGASHAEPHNSVVECQGTSSAQLIHLEPDAGGKGRQHPNHPSDFHGASHAEPHNSVIECQGTSKEQLAIDYNRAQVTTSILPIQTTSDFQETSNIQQNYSISDSVMDLSDSQYCQLATEDFDNSFSSALADASNENIDDLNNYNFEQNFDSAKAKSMKEIAQGKSEGKKLIDSIIASAVLLNKQLLRMKREMETVRQVVQKHKTGFSYSSTGFGQRR